MRWYEPSIGRFINEDTYEGEIMNPLTLNLYTYVHNNPLMYTDPSGHKVKGLDLSFAVALLRYNDWGIATIVNARWEDDITREQFLEAMDMTFITHSHARGGKITGNITKEKKAKPKEVEQKFAERLSNLGYDVKHLRDGNFGGVYGVPRPDYLINGNKIGELKTLNGKELNRETAWNHLAKGISQGADIVFIDASAFHVSELEAYDIIFQGFKEASRQGLAVKNYFEVQIWSKDGIYTHNVGIYGTVEMST